MFSKLKISNIPIQMHLGLTAEEQEKRQKVLITVDFLFSKEPVACSSDAIEETINYAEVAEKIEALCLKKNYRLIEHLAKAIYSSLKERYKEKTRVHIHKCQPPHPLLTNGADFYYGDPAE